MATSSYYAIMRDNKKKEAKQFGNWADKIERVLGKLRTTLSDNQSDINRALHDIQGDLDGAVKQVSAFENNARLMDDHVEKQVSADPNLSLAEDSLEREAKELRRKQEDAQDEADRYEELRREAKAEEDAERERQREEIREALSKMGK